MQERPARLLFEGPEPREFELHDEVVIGRDATCPIHLTDDQVSRSHARIFKAGTGYQVEDLKSRNGIFVNGVRIQNSALLDGDRLKIGRTVLRFVCPPPPPPPPPPPDDRGRTPSTGGALGYREMDDRVIVDEMKTCHELFSFTADPDLDHARLAKANENLKIVCAISEQLTGNFDLEAVLNEVLQRILDVLEAERGVIMLVEDDGVTLTSAAQKARDEKSQAEIAVSQTILRHVLDHRTAVLTADATQDHRFAGGKSIVMQNIRSAACVPLIAHDRIFGILQVESTEKAKMFTRDDLELLIAIGGQAAIAIENVILLRKVEEDAQIRTNLQRYLAPQIAQQVIERKIDLELGGEVQKVTVLFSDIRSFTRMTEELGATEIVATLNEYFSRMVATIFDEGGILDKFVGDAIMALWGGPLAGADSVARALRAAVRMQRELFLLNLRRRALGKPPLYMGVGLNTGDAVVGNMGSPSTMQFTAMGGAVNKASRIEGKTTAWQVLISEATLAEGSALARTRELQPVQLKGIAEPVRVWAVTGLVDDPVPPDLVELEQASHVVSYLRCCHVSSGRAFLGRGFDRDGTFGVITTSKDARKMQRVDVVEIQDTVVQSPSPVATVDGSSPEVATEPLTFRVGSIDAYPDERSPVAVKVRLLTGRDTH
ncbi:MAG: GAF domain-containing protein [Candidatus Riflebacteria bacterium]|nr:GAF domain-containing protein [Candidatus Riflebacteria bacterium]